MALKIFKDAGSESAPRQKYSDDVVGRFRSGYQINGTPAALTEWRVTTGDPEVAAAVRDILGGDEPQKWAARGEDNIEVFTSAKSTTVILEGPRALRTRLVLWGRSGKPIYTTDGETRTMADGSTEPDPDAMLTLNERKQRARDGVGPEPSIEIYFRLEADPDLGLFKFSSASWSLVRDLDFDGTEAAIADIDGPVRCRLGLENVSFVAKNGPRAGQTVSFTKPTIKVLGPA